MNEYCPDKWVVIKIGPGNLYKVFACWYGGYTGSDSWKLNSGITSITQDDGYYLFVGSSGSIYKCRQDLYGTNSYGGTVLEHFIKQAADSGVSIEILDKTVNFKELNYE